jgi:tetratricopeptide (TPR) repeat protein
MPSAVEARSARRTWRLALAAGACAGLLVVGRVNLGGQAGSPAASDTRLNQAARALSAGDPDRAVQLGTAYLNQHPDDPRARVLVARGRIARGDFDAAYLELRKALTAAPRDVDALYYLGLVSARLAEAELGRLARMAPDSARVHQLLADSFVAQDQRPAAAREYQAALKADPNLLEALLGLAKLKRVRLECDEAISLYEKAESLRPTFDGAYGLGVCQSVVQDDEAALAQFELAIKRDPKAAVAWVGAGTSLNKLRRPSDAIPKLLHAIALEPAMGEAYYALGLAYRADNQPERSADAFRKAEQLGGAIGSGSTDSPAPAQQAPQ